MTKNLSQSASTTIYTLVAPSVPSEARKALAEGGDGNPGSTYYAHNRLTKTDGFNQHLTNFELIKAAWELSENLVKKWL